MAEGGYSGSDSTKIAQIAAAINVQSSVAQVDHLHVDGAVFPFTYSYTFNGVTVSYDSVVTDTEADIADGLLDAHNTTALVGTVALAAVAAPGDHEYDVTARVSGLPFTIAAVSANLTLTHPTPNYSVLADLHVDVADIHTDVATIDTVVDTIAADVVETAIGRYQTPTWEDDDIATDAAALAVMTAKVGELDVTHVSLELVDAAHANTTSFRVEHRRAAVVLRTFILDADAPKAVWVTNGGYQVPWEDAAEAFAIDDTLHLVPTGIAGGTNHVKVRVTCRARANGAYMLVTP